MSITQASDKGMRIVAIVGGIIAIIEAILVLTGNSLMLYGFGIIGAICSFIFAIITIGLGIKPIHYTPFILAVLGILLIIVASLIGGIIVLIATFIGLIS